MPGILIGRGESRQSTQDRRRRAAGSLSKGLTLLVAGWLLASCVGTFGRYDATPVGVSSGAALSLTNSYRRSHGLSSLRSNSKLNEAARRQAMTMAERGQIGHGVGGSLPRRVGVTGYQWSRLSENLGKGYPNLNSAFKGWTGSSGHRKNLLNRDMKVAGFGAARSGKDGAIYWAMIMGAPPQRRR